MKILNFLLFILMLILATVQVNGQDLTKEVDTEKKAVLRIMKSYQEALQNLTTEETIELFSEDSEVIESGGVEGSFENYIKYHLGPELEDFETFEFSDYEIDIK